MPDTLQAVTRAQRAKHRAEATPLRETLQTMGGTMSATPADTTQCPGCNGPLQHTPAGTYFHVDNNETDCDWYSDSRAEAEGKDLQSLMGDEIQRMRQLALIDLNVRTNLEHDNARLRAELERIALWLENRQDPPRYAAEMARAAIRGGRAGVYAHNAPRGDA